MDDNDEDFDEVLAVGDRLARELCQGLPKATDVPDAAQPLGPIYGCWLLTERVSPVM